MTGESKECRTASSTLVYVYCTAYCIVFLSYGLVGYYVRHPLGHCKDGYEVIAKTAAYEYSPYHLHSEGRGRHTEQRGVGRETA